ncbi:AEC family transporter [Neoroseomonas lacus]|uniref:Malonate decarboxylase n=1 Tax=Neoroseomonas lacus TaxID=287609 RepID=A0A917NKL9_9PROT|nr:AEC family transporter [Neoroseomonas lacus]GGJ04893.1 malonate decarboxylase [Neoroseomonas lacus]
MTTILLNALAPIFAVMALGYLAGWMRDIDNRHVGELTALVMDFALPASLFAATAATPRAVLLDQLPLVGVFAGSMLLLYTVSFAMQRTLYGLGAAAASVQALTVAQPNYAAAGLPLSAAVFGPAGTLYVALALATASIVLSPLTLAVLEAGSARGPRAAGPAGVIRAISRSLCKPVVLAPLAGIAISLLGIELPDAAERSFALIGQTAGGVALFLTGLILSAQRTALGTNVWSGALLKNVAHPVLAMVLLAALPLDAEARRAAILLCALPSGFFGALFSLRYGVDSGLAGSTLIVSSLASAITLPIALILT